jgi:putative ABC transport system substrate-binding protein
MRRRELILLLGGAASWPLAARAQQPAMPVIALMSSRWPEDSAHLLGAFRRGLREGGFIDGENIAIAFRWTRGDYSRLSTLATDLVSRRVNVISALGASFLSPRGEGRHLMPIVTSFSADTMRRRDRFRSRDRVMDPKRLGLLRDLAPGVLLFGALVIALAARPLLASELAASA